MNPKTTEQLLILRNSLKVEKRFHWRELTSSDLAIIKEFENEQRETIDRSFRSWRESTNVTKKRAVRKNQFKWNARGRAWTVVR